MKTIKFNGITYNEVLDLDSEKADYFYATLIKEDNTVEEIADNVAGCDDIIVTEYDEAGEVIGIKHYTNYPVFEGATLRKDFLIGVENPDTEEETPIYADVVEIVLTGADKIGELEGQVEQQRADIDYIAMETGVDLEV